MQPGVLLTLTAAGLLFFTSLIITINEDWRINTTVLVLQYLGVFGLVSLSWPVELAAVKLVAGGISAAVLAMGKVNLSRLSLETEAPEDPEKPPALPGAKIRQRKLVYSTERVFRIVATLMIALVAASLAPPVLTWIPTLDLPAAWGGLLLLGMGLFQISLSMDPFRKTLGLLTFFSGFEIFFAAIERSLLVAGLLSAVTLGLALAATYLVLAPQLEE